MRLERRLQTILAAIAAFSGAINVLALTGSFYMLQIYDRVLPSRSLATLVGLTLLMASLYTAYGLLDLVRARLLARAGAAVDRELRDHVFAAVHLLPLRTSRGGDGLEPVRDLDQIRAFLSGLGPAAVLDMPWVPVFLTVVFLLHPMLGTFAAAGALILVSLTLLTEMRSRGPLRDAAKAGSERLALAQAARANGEAIRAMGMAPHIQRRWVELSRAHLACHLAAADTIGGIGSASKVLRLLLQSGILGLGAYLVILGDVSAGTIIGASIIMSRSLAPIETAITHWRGFVAARQSYRRLAELFQAMADEGGKRLTLPSPCRSLAVESLSVAPPGTSRPVLHKVSFSLAAGDALGVIGPNAAGKSTLARALFGDPFLVVLDEPSANLDAAGEVALARAVAAVRRRGGIAIIVAHRPSALSGVDKVLALAEGRPQAFGAKEEVLRKVTMAAAVQRPKASLVASSGHTEPVERHNAGLP
jgi:ATP-binding cassette subfamily C protein